MYVWSGKSRNGTQREKEMGLGIPSIYSWTLMLFMFLFLFILQGFCLVVGKGTVPCKRIFAGSTRNMSSVGFCHVEIIHGKGGASQLVTGKTRLDIKSRIKLQSS